MWLILLNKLLLIDFIGDLLKRLFIDDGVSLLCAGYGVLVYMVFNMCLSVCRFFFWIFCSDGLVILMIVLIVLYRLFLVFIVGIARGISLAFCFGCGV